MNQPALDQSSRLLVVAPHPDDETLGAGVLIRTVLGAGGAVRVVFITDGDNNPWPQRFVERRLRMNADARARWGARRRTESREAMQRLGLDPTEACYLGFPDQGMTTLLLTGANSPIDALADTWREFRPTHVTGPSRSDRHPDHSATAVILDIAQARLGHLAAGTLRLDYLVHGTPPDQGDIHAVTIRVDSADVERIRHAIEAYASQLALSRRRFLAYARAEHIFERRPRLDTLALPGPTAPKVALRHAGDDAIIAVRTSRMSRLIARRTLHVIAMDRTGQTTVRRATFRGTSARMRFVSPGADQPTLRGHHTVDAQSDLVTMPPEVLGCATSVYIRVTRRPSWFFADGWASFAWDGATPPPAAAPVAVVPEANVCAVIPCFNVAQFCESVVRESTRYAERVIAVDDGSTDGTGKILQRLAAEPGARVDLVTLPANAGKGVALLAGFRRALAWSPCELVITLDGDRQHRPEDIRRLVRCAREESADFVIGERDQIRTMPLRSRLGNEIIGRLLRFAWHHAPLDTQSGFRALRRAFVEDVVRLVPGRRYETELYILLLALSSTRRVASTQIPTVYLDGNRSSHFRPLADSFRILRALASWRAPSAATGA